MKSGLLLTLCFVAIGMLMMACSASPLSLIHI